MRILTGLACVLALACGDDGTSPPGLHAVEIRTPNLSSFLANDTAQLDLVGRDRAGAPYVAGPARWRSTNSTAVSVDSLGLVVGKAVGSAIIIGSVGDLSDSVTIAVTGTRHRWAITASETWALAGSPHLVQGRLAVGRPFGTPATLTIEAGATVVFSDTAGLTFGLDGPGRLLAQGTPAAPITLRDTAPPPAAVPGAWIGLTFRGGNSSELHHVTLSGCGRARTDDQPRGCLVLGHRFGGPSPTVLMDNVTVQDAAGGAIVLQQTSRFAPGSAGLSVRRMRGHIATLAAASAKDLPLGTFSANDTNEVRLTRDTLRESLTLVAGIPWTIVEPVLVEGPLQPVLTIPAGVTVRLAAGAAVVVGKDARGGLRIGTDGGPAVTLRQTTTTWGGIDFFPAALPSFIYDAVLEACGGGNDSGSGRGCVNIVGNSNGTDPAPILKNVTIRNGSVAGVVLIGGASFGAGSSNLTITGITGPAFAFESSSPGSTPSGQYTGNAPDPIPVSNVQITRSETWRNLGAAYLIYGGLGIGHAANPTLTLDPGVVLRFPPGAILQVGWVATGNLRAIGTPSQPIVFTGQFDHPGSWMGVMVGPYADATTVFEYITVENGGADDGQFATGFRLAREMGPFITNTLVRRSAGCGITRLSGSPWTTDFTAPALGNRFEENTGAAQCGP